jgi:alpha-maltose-1-phosphate synthase
MRRHMGGTAGPPWSVARRHRTTVRRNTPRVIVCETLRAYSLGSTGQWFRQRRGAEWCFIRLLQQDRPAKRHGGLTVKAVLFTREYPPGVYGGAGVHVEYLARELARLIPVEVRCFGGGRKVAPEGPAVRAYEPWIALAGDALHSAALSAMSVNLAMAGDPVDGSVVHSHTWYANFAGHLAKLIHRVPHVATTHSLEPLRPWKAEQLGRGGYALSCFCERTALLEADVVIAVSEGMRQDVLSVYPAIAAERVCVIHNGIDTDEYRPDANTDVLERYGVRTDGSYVLFVGRMTRQKGITHLLDAAPQIDSDAQIVLCAGAPDTPEIAREVNGKVESIRDQGGNVVWIESMLPKREVIQLLSHATVFCCPSLYEPLGIVNLEAMACKTAVVGTATGGIPEVVEDGETGYLVPFEAGDEFTREPRYPRRFSADLAERINWLVTDPATAARFGSAGRRRAIERFTWSRVAEKTVRLYERVLV